MQSLKSPYTLYNQQSVGSTLHNNLLFITCAAFLVDYGDNCRFFRQYSSPRILLCVRFMFTTSLQVSPKPYHA